MRLNKLMADMRGVTHVVVIAVVIVGAVVLYGGYRVVASNKSEDKALNQSAQTAPVTQADLERASTELEDQNLDESLDPAQLDGDLQELL